MKAQKEYLSANMLHSFRVKHTILPYMDSPWHYHPDYELIYIVNGTGKRFVGDSVENFTHGDLVLLGPNLPHVWKNDDCYHQAGSAINAEVIVIQFKHDAFGDTFFSLPEFKEISKMLDFSSRGMKITGRTRTKVIKEMWAIIDSAGINRIIGLLNILNHITDLNDLTPLCSSAFKRMRYEQSSEKLNKVLEHIVSNFQKPIQLDDVANLATMSKTAFCRFFKLKTTKTFNQYLTDVRIGYACELLMDSDLSVAQISALCGFNNQSFFNRQFKLLKDATPSEYQQRYKNMNEQIQKV
ncbi:AraC family transcriptional regulator [Carboxylicivirga mesophila]|uniref:AraC family transcriptional regulator n=1 Tax=Carboxylicivirga mesophila TaxID=1166478 RepID=A0ABS5K7M1_9BACT|nr:AraC family transcriptional regulator [Carboxylicivirga mesophila]MBS2210999.1 AraC family transcriptional regulator [Carboxylicivirga mesophila]